MNRWLLFEEPMLGKCRVGKRNRLLPLAKTMKPAFLGLGVHKGGSTWIYQVLYEHSALCVPEKDLHFFSVERVWKNGRPWYEALFRRCRPGLVCGEYSNTYFPSARAAERIHALYPEVKLFVCLRHPVERAFSHYLQDLKMGHLAPGTAFEAALDRHPQYLEWGRYAQHLTSYLDLFDREQMGVLLFDDLVDNPSNFVRTLYRFLDVADDFLPAVLGRHVNVSRLPRWRFIDQFMRRTAETLRRSHAGARLWGRLKKTGMPDRVRRWNTSSIPPPALSGEMRTQLQTVFAADIAYVKSFLNRPDLRW